MSSTTQLNYKELYEQLLKDLNYKYEVFLNRPRNKCLSEAVILRGN